MEGGGGGRQSLGLCLPACVQVPTDASAQLVPLSQWSSCRLREPPSLDRVRTQATVCPPAKVACFFDLPIIHCAAQLAGHLQVIDRKWKREVVEWLFCKPAYVDPRLMRGLWALHRFALGGVRVAASSSSGSDVAASLTDSGSPTPAPPVSRKPPAPVQPVTDTALTRLLAVYHPTVDTAEKSCPIAPFTIKVSFMLPRVRTGLTGHGRGRFEDQCHRAQVLAAALHSGMFFALCSAMSSLVAVAAVLCLEQTAPRMKPRHAAELHHDLHEPRAAAGWAARVSTPAPNSQLAPDVPDQSTLLQEAHALRTAIPGALSKAEGGSAAQDTHDVHRLKLLTHGTAQLMGFLVALKSKRGVVEWLCCKRSYVDPRLMRGLWALLRLALSRVAPMRVAIAASIDSAAAPFTATAPTRATDVLGQIVPFSYPQVRSLRCKGW